jgi:hypothetical protein
MGTKNRDAASWRGGWGVELRTERYCGHDEGGAQRRNNIIACERILCQADRASYGCIAQRGWKMPEENRTIRTVPCVPVSPCVPVQRQKIRCGERHFEALESGVVFSPSPVKSWREFKAGV